MSREVERLPDCAPVLGSVRTIKTPSLLKIATRSSDPSGLSSLHSHCRASDPQYPLDVDSRRRSNVSNAQIAVIPNGEADSFR